MGEQSVYAAPMAKILALPWCATSWLGPSSAIAAYIDDEAIAHAVLAFMPMTASRPESGGLTIFDALGKKTALSRAHHVERQRQAVTPGHCGHCRAADGRVPTNQRLLAARVPMSTVCRSDDSAVHTHLHSSRPMATQALLATVSFPALSRSMATLLRLLPFRVLQLVALASQRVAGV